MRRATESVLIALMAVVLAISLTGIRAAEPSPDSGLRPDERFEQTVLGYLRQPILAAKKVGRLYYVVPCKNPDHDFPAPFPEVKAQAALNGHIDLEAVREIFRDDKRVAVSEETDGIIRIHIGEVPAAILKTKIPILRLKPIQQYDPAWATMALTDSKAVQVAMRKLGLKEAPFVFSLASNLPAKPAPHLPTVLKNVTLDQALDMVAKTFRVVVVFGECTDGIKASFIRVNSVPLQSE